MKNKGFAILFLAVMISIGSGAVISSQIPKDVLIIGAVISDATNLDPAQTLEATSLWVIRQVYDTLVALSSDFSKAVPALAESWELKEGGRTWVFKLKRGVKFHSGNEVTAEAVAFSLRRALQLKFAPSSILTAFIASEGDIKTPDKWTVQITFKQPMPETLLASILASPVSAILDHTVIKKQATKDDPWATKWLSDREAGSGPFKLVKWEKKAEIVLEAFPGYWRGRAKLSRVIIREITDPETRRAALEKGEIDVAVRLLPEQYRDLRGKPGIVVKGSPVFSLFYLGMNRDFEPLSKKEALSAIKWAIDYKAITEEVFKGAAEVGQTIIPARMFAHLPEHPFQKDVTKAKQLLRQAGLEKGFKVELALLSDPTRQEIGVRIKKDLEEIGITVEIKALGAREIGALYRERRHQMILAGWLADYPDPDNFARPFADFDARSMAWRNGWKNDRASELVRQAAVEPDLIKRKAMYEEIQRITQEEGPYAVLYYPLRQLAMRTNVRGLEPSPITETTELFLASKE